jgi:ABC-type dipeptide/oligopeptide/nickel transport system permease component
VLAFIAKRIAYAVAVLFAATSLVFGLIFLAGDPLAGLVPPGASPEQEAVIRRRFALDRPVVVQYARFVEHAVQGDFGESWRRREPAMDAVLSQLPATLKLTAAAMVLALLIGIPVGIAAGTRPGGWRDAAATGFALLGQAIPAFWLGTVLILLFAVELQWLPSSGGGGFKALILPAVALAAFPAATIARLLRSSLIETMSQDFIRTARGKGLSKWAVVRVHAVRNAFLPVLGFAGLQISFLLGGAVIIESVFAYPGVGRLALQAVSDRDIPVVASFVVVLATMIVLTNFIVDLIARVFDPRLRSGSQIGRAG